MPAHAESILLPGLPIAGRLALRGRVFAEGRDAPAQAYDATIAAHRERQAELTALSEQILARADKEGRDLSSDEDREINDNSVEFDRLEREIGRREAVARQSAAVRQAGAPGQNRRTTPDDSASAEAEPPRRAYGSAARDDGPATRRMGTFGFRGWGEYCAAVRDAAINRTNVDTRLLAATSTYGSEGVGPDGGFAVPPDFAATIQRMVFGEDSLIARTDQRISSGRVYTSPVDETTPWSTGGIRTYWEGEAATITKSKPQLTEKVWTLAKITCEVPLTAELLEDVPAMGAYVEAKAPENMDFAVSHAIVSGTGAGMPLGILNAGALLTVAAEGSQTADTIRAENVAKMYAAMPGRKRSSAVWLVHPDVESQFLLMTLGGTATVAGQPVYMPPGGFSDSPYARLFGRPVIPHEACNALGDLGDILFADLSSYVTIRRTIGARQQVSIHAYWEQDITAYRFIMRIGGGPAIASPITHRSGGTMSPFVTLGAR